MSTIRIALWNEAKRLGMRDDAAYNYIRRNLAQGVETRSTIDAERRGPNGESAVAKGDPPK